MQAGRLDGADSISAPTSLGNKPGLCVFSRAVTRKSLALVFTHRYCSSLEACRRLSFLNACTTQQP